MNIWEIKEEIENVLAAYEEGIDEVVDGETGEIIPLKKYLDNLEASKSEKITNVALFIKNREAMVGAIKNQIKILNDRIKKENKKIADAENYIRLATEETNFDDNEGRFVIRFKKNPPSVEIDKGAIVPEEYMRTKTTKEPDKKKLKAAIDGGKKFNGIRLVTGIGMSIK